MNFPKKNQCERCGTCCRNGGPPLHTQDIELIRSGALIFDDLVTVRRGELVLPPMGSEPLPAETEWIKLQGSGGEWCCRFFDTNSRTCSIHKVRPVSCRVLKCWDTEEILSMAGKSLLRRTDLIDSNDPVLPLIIVQEKQCPVPDLEGMASRLNTEAERDSALKKLNTLVQMDLQIRFLAVRDFKLSVDRELFYLGRPLFQLLGPLGLRVKETPQGIQLQFAQHG